MHVQLSQTIHVVEDSLPSNQNYQIFIRSYLILHVHVGGLASVHEIVVYAWPHHLFPLT